MLLCSNLTCSRNGRNIFEDLSFKAEKESLTIIKGDNGSGKTTLLKSLAGIIRYNSGSITWNGGTIENNEEYIRNISFIGHKSSMDGNLTVEDNLNFWAELNNTKEAVAAAIVCFNLGRVYDMPYHKLSEGWKRKVALARLLACPKIIWLLDEPTVNLDSEGVNILVELIKSRIQQKGLVIISTNTEIRGLPNHQEVNLKNV